MKLKRASVTTLIVILVLLTYTIISSFKIDARIDEALKTKVELEAQVQALEVENASLQYEISHSQDADTIEKVARDKLGLVLPGEIIFYDMGG